MSSEQTAASETTEALPSDSAPSGGTTEGTDLRAEITRLQQGKKKAEDMIRQAMPHTQIGLALRQIPGGEAIIEKIERAMQGEDVSLTDAQERKVEQAADAAGVTKEDLKQMLEDQAKQFEQRMWEADKAKETMDDLNTWAAKEYPGYNELRKTTQWKQRLNMVLAGIQQGSIDVPDQWSDPYQFAIDEAYSWVKAKNPDIGKETPAKTDETTRRATAAQAMVQAGGAPPPEDQDGLPEWARLDTPSRRLGGGRPFSSLKRE